MLVGYEMTWTVNFFLFKQCEWESRELNANAGLRAYAARTSAMWGAMADNAQNCFTAVNPAYKMNGLI